MDSKFFETDPILAKTFELMRRGETEVKLHEQYKKIILVLGDTGHGKTKMVMWIADDNGKLISKAVNAKCREYTIEETNDSSRCIITSDTIYPRMVIDVETNSVFYDCPGFNDTRTPSHEIATTFFIKKVLDHTESVKLIFTINYPAVRKGVDRRSFMNLMKHITNFMKDIEKFKNSIALVVTKVDNQYTEEEEKGITLVDSEEMIETVAEFLIEVKRELEVKLQSNSSEERHIHEVAVKFISILLVKDGEQYSRIGIFRRPNKPGLVSEIPLLQEGKKPVKTMILEKLEFSIKENDDFGYTLSEDCKNEILHLVEAINKSIKYCLSRIICEIKEHFTEIVNVLMSTVQSFLGETTSSADLEKARELTRCLRDGYCTVLSLVENVKCVSNPEELAQKINAVACYLNIGVSTDDLVEIENNGECFNFLQVVSDEKLSTIQWDELFQVFVLYLLNASEELQKDAIVVEPKVCMRIESCFQKIAKTLQDQFDERAKTLDMNDVLVELNLYHKSMMKIIEETSSPMHVTKLLSLVRDVLQDVEIILPEQDVLDVAHQEEIFITLQTIGETKVEFVPWGIWNLSFQKLVQHLDESKIWYKFLDNLYATFSEYEIQNNREKYNVAYIKDWAKSGKPQGIFLTKNNFEEFVSNLETCNILECGEDLKNITLTELRLNELNDLLNLTLKHRADIKYDPPHIFIRADYISIKEILVYSEQNSDDVHNLLNAFKSGECKFLHIFALRKVFIDGDLSLPGVELSIISPEWKIIGIRTINLDGADGASHSEINPEDGADDVSHSEINPEEGADGVSHSEIISKEGADGVSHSEINPEEGADGVSHSEIISEEGADAHSEINSDDGTGCVSNSEINPEDDTNHGSNGKNGEPGLPGKPGGNFFGIAASVINGFNLTVTVNGGNGGQGQDGGNGLQGENGEGLEHLTDKDLPEWDDNYRGYIVKGFRCKIQKNWSGLHLLVSFLKIFNGDIGLNRLYEIPGLPGKTGGDGGDGGKGGKGGYPGFIHFFHLNEKSKLICISADKGKTGKNGNGGLGGNGGMNGHTKYGLLNGLMSSKWMFQFEKPDNTFSTDRIGKNGTNGRNSSGLKDPEPANDISEPFKIIENYKIYSKENLLCRFKRPTLLSFIDLLNYNDEIKNLYTVDAEVST